MQISSVQTELPIADKNLVDMRQLFEVIVHTLYHHHRLTTMIDSQRLILHALRSHINLWQLADFREHRIVGSHRLTFCWRHLQLRIERGEERGHEVVEAVEHGESHYQRHRRHRHSND